MKHVKMLGLLIVAAASLMAFASSASAAPVLTGPNGEEYTGTIDASLKGTATLKAGIEDTCTESTVHGTVTTNNTTHAAGNITTLSFNKCTKHTTVLASGSLTIGDDGTVTAFNNEVTVNDTALGISCVYGGGSTGTAIGKLIPGVGWHVTVETTKLKKITGSFFCASEGTWTGTYVGTTPSSLTIT
ncbi:MAG: hypothetical protein ACTHNY_12785 [Solirubrobacterales bacterium]